MGFPLEYLSGESIYWGSGWRSGTFLTFHLCGPGFESHLDESRHVDVDLGFQSLSDYMAFPYSKLSGIFLHI